MSTKTKHTLSRKIAMNLLAISLGALAVMGVVSGAPTHAQAGERRTAVASAASTPNAGAATDKTSADKASNAPTGTVNLNTATEDELSALPGVGPSKAARIVDYRKKHGAFKKIEELTHVKGFGYKSFKRLKPYLAVTGTTTLKGKRAPATTAHAHAAAQPAAMGAETHIAQ